MRWQGGVTGVRGFATGDVSVDDGALASLELARRFGSHLTLAAFYDLGRGDLSHRPTGPGDNNTRTVQSAGASATLFAAGSWALKGTAAFPVGGEQGDRDSRWWAQAVKYF